MKTALELQQEVANLKAEIHQKDTLISGLQSQLFELKKHRFGSSSEKDKNQLPLFNEAEAIVDALPKLTAKGKKKKAGIRNTLPPGLEREEEIYDLDEDQKICPKDSCELKLIGEECNEQLKFIPASIKVIKHKRLKYACTQCNKHIITATKPKDPIPKSIASPELLSYISVSKYTDGLPLYRLSQMFKRLNIKVSRTNMANWMIKCGALIQPLINLMQDEIYSQCCIQIDETTLQVLKEPGKKASSKSYMWVMRAADIILFNYDPSRASKVAEKLLVDYDKAIMCDGYAGYDSAVAKNKITRLGCWAHARRYFIKVTDQGKNQNAQNMINLIGLLYAIEKRIKDNNYKPDKVKEIRSEQSDPILKEIRQLLDEILHSTTPSGLMGKALGYLNNQWPNLIGYTKDGNYPIDNNAAENAIRPFVIGRKNWLFTNSIRGAKASANLYSIIETAKAHNLNPEEYLTNIYRQLPNTGTIEDFEKLLPWNFKPD
jgi:transposase